MMVTSCAKHYQKVQAGEDLRVLFGWLGVVSASVPARTVTVVWERWEPGSIRTGGRMYLAQKLMGGVDRAESFSPVSPCSLSIGRRQFAEMEGNVVEGLKPAID